MQSMSVNQKALIAFIVGLLLGIGATWLWFEKGSGAAMKEDKEVSSTKEMSDASDISFQTAASIAGVVASGEGSILVLPQSPGMTVAIAKVVMPQSGWVAIHEEGAAGVPGRILGAQRFDAGTFTGVVELLRSTVLSGTYYAMLRIEDGDMQFDPKKDVPMLSPTEKMIVTTFVTQ